MIRAALYARYSSDLQRDASIADQLRLCRERAERLGAEIAKEFTDAALSGATMNRPGIRALLEGARAGDFDVVISEALDRLSRDQEDIAGIHKRLTHAGVRLLTLAEGDDVNELHIGLKGTMNALFLKDLAAKVRRGMRGRIAEGFLAGGNAYGYDVVREFGPDGAPVRGKRRIDPDQADVIRRVFAEYVAGRTTRQIAATLNAEGVPAPRGRGWSYRRILGDRERMNGILSNPLYVGRLTWNRQTFRKDPDTGRNVGRLNPRDKWVVVDVPELRIVDQATWDQAQAIMQSRSLGPIHVQRRPRRLLSGLVYCASCGGTCRLVMQGYFGCGNSHAKRTCDNRRLIRAEEVERRVLEGMRTRLLALDMVDHFARTYRELWKRRRAELARGQASRSAERRDLERKIANLVDAIADGGGKDLRAKLRDLTARRDALAGDDHAAEAPNVVDLHPNLADAYRRKIEALEAALRDDNSPTRQAAARAIIRSLVSRVVLVPGAKRKQVGVQLYGQIEELLALAAGGQTTFKAAGVRGSTRSWRPPRRPC